MTSVKHMLTTKGTQRPMPQDRICIVASKEFFLNTKTLVLYSLKNLIKRPIIIVKKIWFARKRACLSDTITCELDTIFDIL